MLDEVVNEVMETAVLSVVCDKKEVEGEEGGREGRREKWGSD